MTIYDKTQDEKIQFPVGIGIIQTEPVRNFYNTSDATATSSDIVVGKTAYSRYGIINGELDLQNEKETSYQEGYEFGYDEGNDAGYILGKEDGKELGREEIISEQSDANITPNDVLEGKIAYGKNNEKIVGTNVGGFDFSTIGYTLTENQATNEYYANALKYSQELYDTYVPTTDPRFKSDTELVYAPSVDTSIATNMNGMFSDCYSLTFVPLFDTSNVTNMGSMFSNCYTLKTVPLFDTSNVTNMGSMFNTCYTLKTVPLFDTSNVTTMTYMFYNCYELKTVPLFDTSNVTNMSYMFSYCRSLESIPSFNCVKNTTFYSFITSSKLKSIGKLRCDSTTSVQYFVYFTTLSALTDLGGFENLGMQPTLNGTNDSYFLNAMPNLTKQSLLNVLNGLYDRASAGYSTLTLKLHNNHKALLSDNELAIATNKGWIIS